MATMVPVLAGALLWLGAALLAAPSVSYAEPCEHGRHVGNPHCTEDPPDGPLSVLPVVPELDSLVLFGAGALGLVGFGWYQRRKQSAS